jgi:hypothetical protein
MDQMSDELSDDSLKEYFGKIFDALKEKVGAAESYREIFIPFALNWWRNHYWQSYEFRFMGSLGMGGKIWLDPEGYRVSCYSEDMTVRGRRSSSR